MFNGRIVWTKWKMLITAVSHVYTGVKERMVSVFPLSSHTSIPKLLLHSKVNHTDNCELYVCSCFHLKFCPRKKEHFCHPTWLITYHSFENLWTNELSQLSWSWCTVTHCSSQKPLSSESFCLELSVIPFPRGRMIRHLSFKVEKITPCALWFSVSCVILPLLLCSRSVFLMWWWHRHDASRLERM